MGKGGEGLAHERRPFPCVVWPVFHLLSGGRFGVWSAPGVGACMFCAFE